MALGQFVARKPIVRLELLANKSYASVIFIVFTVGAGLYCVSYLVPQFLSNIAGYNAEQSGDIMLLAGLPAFLMMPILPRLLGRVDPRIMVIVGLLLFAVSCMLDISLTAQSVGHDFYWSQTAARRGTDVRDDAAQSGVDGRGVAGRGRRRGGPLQHGAQSGRFGRSRAPRNRSSTAATRITMR